MDNLARLDPARCQAALSAGRLTGEQFDRAAAAGRRAFYEPLFTDANEALEVCERLQGRSWRVSARTPPAS